MRIEQSQPAARRSYFTLQNLMMIAVMRMKVTGASEKQAADIYKDADGNNINDDKDRD